MLFHFFIQAAFDVEVFDDSFDNQIAVFELRQIVFKVSDRDECSTLRSEEGRRFRFFCGFEPGASNLISICFVLRNDIEQERRNSRVSQVSGDLRPHRARAQDSSFFDLNHGR